MQDLAMKHGKFDTRQRVHNRPAARGLATQAKTGVADVFRFG